MHVQPNGRGRQIVICSLSLRPNLRLLVRLRAAAAAADNGQQEAEKVRLPAMQLKIQMN